MAKSKIHIEYDEKEVKVTFDLTEFSLRVRNFINETKTKEVYDIVFNILENYKCTNLLQDQDDPTKTYIMFTDLEELFRFKLEYGDYIAI